MRHKGPPSKWHKIGAFVCLILAISAGWDGLNKSKTSIIEATLLAVKQVEPTITVSDCTNAFARFKGWRLEADRRANGDFRESNDEFRNKYLSTVEIAGSRFCWEQIGRDFVVADNDLAQYSEVRRMYYFFNMDDGKDVINGHVADNLDLPLNPEK